MIKLEKNLMESLRIISKNFSKNFFKNFLIFIEGFILTSRVFHEIQTPARSQFYLTLPARTSEKLISNWLLSSFIYIVAAYAGLFLVLVVASLLAAGIFNSPIEVFNPFSAQQVELMGHYLVLQTIFFLGSVYFRKNNFLNTVLSVFAVGIVLSIWSGLVGWMLLPIPNFAITVHEFELYSENGLKILFGVLYWGLFAPFFLTVSYFTLKEREI